MSLTPGELDDLIEHGDENEDLSALDRGSEFEGELPDDEEGAAALAREKAAEEARLKAEEEAAKAKEEEARLKAEEEAAKAKDGKPEDKPEGETDPKPEGETDPKPEGEEEVKGHMIPKARFDEAQRRAREREAELAAELAAERAKSAQHATKETVDKLQAEIDTLDTQYAAALKDGETEAAAKLMKDIRAKERELAKAETGIEAQNIAVREAQAAEAAVFDVILKGFEEQYPEMDPDPQNEAYDQAKVDAIITLMNGYVATGQPRANALKQAMTLLAPTLKPRSAPAPAADTRTEVQKKVEAERKAAATSKTAKALESQPASLKDAGLDSHKVGGGIDESQVNNMTEEEFDALPESVKARMRGDSF